MPIGTNIDRATSNVGSAFFHLLQEITTANNDPSNASVFTNRINLRYTESAFNHNTIGIVTKVAAGEGETGPTLTLWGQGDGALAGEWFIIEEKTAVLNGLTLFEKVPAVNCAIGISDLGGNTIDVYASATFCAAPGRVYSRENPQFVTQTDIEET